MKPELPSSSPAQPAAQAHSTNAQGNALDHKVPPGLGRFVPAAINSMKGFAAALKHESAFRQECVLALVMVPAAFWVGQSWAQIALLIALVLLVLVVELLNSAVEAAIDRIGLDLHDLSGRAKDYGSAAVFLCLSLCGGVWAVALWVRLVG